MTPEPVEILLVEDNPGDARLTREALHDAHVLNNLHNAVDGVEAMAFLHREGKFASAPRPDLILLDLNLPRMGGRDVLVQIKSDPHLKRIPVIILTSSHSEEDVLNSYELHANAYMSKPVELDDFINAVNSLQAFWLHFVKLPAR